MADYPDNLHYTRDHEWLRVEGEIGTVGLTAFAQKKWGQVLSVQLPRTGENFDANDSMGEIESVKDGAEIYAPVSGRVIAINEALADETEAVNDDPYGEGWLIRLELENTGEVDRLLSSSEYEDFIESQTEE